MPDDGGAGRPLRADATSDRPLRANATSDRPLRADARRNRDRVLEVARDAFAAEGLSVPLDDIARRAHVGPGTLYRHFPTKDVLIQAVLLDRLRELASAGTVLRDSADPGAAFFAYLDRLAEEAGPKRDLFDALASGGIDVGPEVLAAAANVRGHVTGLFERAKQAGAVRRDLGGDELMALLGGLLFAMRPGSGANQALVLSVFRDGLRPRLPASRNEQKRATS
ncbi:MAG TPA: helix-turn-helix domain-containing protein [Trebonia sp.]|nr:helix-turn-helix domain-containing protein [Trebonia sp.]